MKKTFRPLLLVLAVVFSMSLVSCESIQDAIDYVFPKKGIKEDISLGYVEVKPEMFTFSPYYTPVYDEVSYTFLENEGEQQLYRRLLENAYYIYPEVASEISTDTVNYYKTKQIVLEDYVLSESQVRTVIKALTDDYPQIFWLSQTFGYKTEQDRNYTAVQLYSTMTGKEVTKDLSLLVENVNKFFADVPKDQTAYQLEKYVHDYLLENCDYDMEVAENEDYNSFNSNAFNICGVMNDNEAVCEGYSRTFQFLCKNLGIKCVNIIGESEGENHMWNAVSLGDDWYNIDVTWDDTATEDFSKYDYFNVSDKVLSDDHTTSKLFSEMSDDEINGTDSSSARTMNMFVPTCDQMAYNYYVRTLAHLTDYDGEAVITAIYDCANNKLPYCQIYIDPASLDYNEAVNKLLSEEDPLLKRYIDTANSLLEDAQIDSSSVKYVKKEKLNVLTLIFNYV